MTTLGFGSGRARGATSSSTVPDELTTGLTKPEPPGSPVRWGLEGLHAEGHAGVVDRLLGMLDPVSGDFAIETPWSTGCTTPDHRSTIP